MQNVTTQATKTRTFRNADKLGLQAQKELIKKHTRGKTWSRQGRTIWEEVE